MYEDSYSAVNHGTFVRDTACYVCWTFARAFSPDEFKEFALDLIGLVFLLNLNYLDIYFVLLCLIENLYVDEQLQYLLFLVLLFFRLFYKRL